MSVRTLVKSIQNIMRKDPGVDGDAQRISQLCWMFFLKIIDDQDQELEMMSADYASPIPQEIPVACLGGGPGGDHRRRTARLCRRRPVPDPEEPPIDGAFRRPPPSRSRRVRGRVQLHEVGPVNATGRQQDQRHRLQQPDRTSAFRRHLRTDPERPAIGGQRRRVLHAPRRHRLYGRPH